MSNLTFDFCDTSRVIQEIPPDERPAQTMNGWVYSPRPKTPFQRTFKCTLYGMDWIMADYGPDLIPAASAGFDASTGWTLSNATISSSRLNFTTTAGAASRDLGAGTGGRTYRVTVDVGVTGPLRVLVGYPGNANALGTFTPSGVGTFTYEYTVDVDRASITLTLDTGGGAVTAKPTYIQVNMKTTGLLDKTTTPKINAGALLDFYRAHRCWDSFLLNHEYLGVIRVRFNKPVTIPPGKPDAGGFVEEVEVEFVEDNPSY